ncbi:MAG TPA: hypothetical protein P5517_07325 [Candidatus Saccharicenans sp.]|jgi:hypothetical protein|nr:hypothetical protein [Candidatus Saccharicenans sp.]HQE65028.1 hypothetical protein [Candidatus Saccharicenans sp.]HQI23087.1 hypothetical protein [Candidatus Saccharicenans sp.]HRT26223.1 hypothetical protein [Candidatus Saccharicenans sp.]HRV06683.1 hypothetical protein [Candidatus Saccharicenans sp.]
MRENSHNRKISKAAAGVVALTTILILLEAPGLLWLEPAYGQPGNLSPQLAQLDSQLPEEIRVALKAAEDNLKLPEGKKYDEALGPALASDLNRIMNECLQTDKASPLQPFTVLARVSLEGKVEEVYVWPQISIATCLKSALSGIQFPEPPGPSWWTKIDISFQVQAPNPEDFQSNGAIVYGSEAAVLVSSPDGWVIDNVSGVSQGLHCVMYPEGSSWEKGNEVMYINISLCQPGETIEDSIAGDMVRFKKNYPEAIINELEPVVTVSGEKVLLRTFNGGGYKNYEAVGYARFKNSLICYVLTSRDKKGFEANLNNFKKMIAGSIIMEMGKTKE